MSASPIADRPPLEYDEGSKRPCKKCLHVESHDYWEYGATGSACRHERTIRHHCDEHKRHSKRCDESEAGGCYSESVSCGCSEDDRLIADLRSWINVLEGHITRAALSPMLRGGKMRA